jgi:hypothetical protein
LPNRSMTKLFLIEILLKMIDSWERSPEEFEYDNQNCHRHQKTQVWLKNPK